MKKEINTLEFVILILLVSLTKMTPLSAVLAFGLVLYYMTNHLSISIMMLMVANLVSDALVHTFIYPEFSFFYPGFYWQYIAFIVAILPIYFVQSKWSMFRVFTTTLSASTIFFLVSNFGVWMSMDFYPANAAGLATCYIAGIPFYLKSLLTDMLAVVGLYGVLWSVRFTRNFLHI